MIKTLGFASRIPVPCVKGSAFFRCNSLHSTHNRVNMNRPLMPKRIAEGHKPSLRAAGIALSRTFADITSCMQARGIRRRYGGGAEMLGKPRCRNVH